MSSTSSEQRMHFEILGQSFSIKTDESPEYIQDLVSELKQRYAMISGRMNVADPLRIAILASFFLLDEVKKRRAQNAQPSAVSVSQPQIRAGASAGSSALETKPAAKDTDEAQILEELDRRLGELGL